MVRGQRATVRKARGFALRSYLVSEKLLKDALPDLSRLFFTSCGMRGHIQPHLQNVGNRNSVAYDACAKYRFPVCRSPDIDIRLSARMIYRQAETTESVQRQALEIDMRCHAMNETISQCIGGSE